jgi:cysteine desulfurase
MFWSRSLKRVYVDYAAATPLSIQAKAAMMPYLDGNFANPSAIHAEGQIAKEAVVDARARVARAFQVRPQSVTFTSGGTESNNLAIRGALMAVKQQSGKQLKDIEVLTLRTEHPATLKTVEALSRRGIQAGYVAVDAEGLVTMEALRNALTEKTALVTIAYANSEIGTVQKLHTIRKAIAEAEEKFGTTILLHVDAAQAPLWLNCQFDAMKADLVSYDAAKCNGPKGVGVLLRSRRATLVPITYGGGQEDGLRPGTENVAGVVGAAAALENAQDSWKERAQATATIRDEAIKHIKKELPQAILNGSAGDSRLANNINISIPGLDTEFATVVLDKHGFAVSTKSACAGVGGGESAVVREISGDPARAASTLRISLAPDTKLSDLQRLTAVLKSHIEQMSSY